MPIIIKGAAIFAVAIATLLWLRILYPPLPALPRRRDGNSGNADNTNHPARRDDGKNSPEG